METIDLFLAHPVALFVVLAIGAAIGTVLEKTFAAIDREKRQAYWAGRNAGQKRGQFGPIAGKSDHAKTADMPIAGKRGVPDAAGQLRCVMAADFRSRALLNRPEAAVFKALDTAVIARNPRWQVMAQVSLGEFLITEDKDAYLAVNSKRVDFALMDPDCRVRHALEYQGTGHHQGTAAARDAVKKEALRKARIGYHEIVAGHTTPGELKRLIDKLVPLPECALEPEPAQRPRRPLAPQSA